MNSITEKLKNIEYKIEETLRKNNISHSVKILAATKKQSLKTLLEAFQAGVRIFGENYLQEAMLKQKQFEGEAPQQLQGALINNQNLNTQNLNAQNLNVQGAKDFSHLEWHLIGHIQSKKIKEVVHQRFALIHSVDNIKTLEKLNFHCEEQGHNQQILLQVKVGDEETKSGCLPEELPFLVEACAELEHISLQGLMAMPPLCESESESRSYFSRVRTLAEGLKTQCHPTKDSLEILSMGTSHDYLWAIAEGATLVRLGTVLLGERKWEK